MKIKYGNRKGWRRVLESTYTLSTVKEDPSILVATVHILKVSSPLLVNYDNQEYNVADNGYQWMQYFFKDKHYVITTVVNNKNEIIQWYIDLCRPYKLTIDGIPYFVDLYLDIVVFPSYKVFVLDEDELEDARNEGLISLDEYHLIWDIANQLLTNFQQQNYHLLDITKSFHNSRQ